VEEKFADERGEGERSNQSPEENSPFYCGKKGKKGRKRRQWKEGKGTYPLKKKKCIRHINQKLSKKKEDKSRKIAETKGNERRGEVTRETVQIKHPRKNTV